MFPSELVSELYSGIYTTARAWTIARKDIQSERTLNINIHRSGFRLFWSQSAFHLMPMGSSKWRESKMHFLMHFVDDLIVFWTFSFHFCRTNMYEKWGGLSSHSLNDGNKDMDEINRIGSDTNSNRKEICAVKRPTWIRCGHVKWLYCNITCVISYVCRSFRRSIATSFIMFCYRAGGFCDGRTKEGDMRCIAGTSIMDICRWKKDNIFVHLARTEKLKCR